ncbi:MAG: four-carbon acid sugar kinase family protein, partial [Clostridia bacterium]
MEQELSPLDMRRAMEDCEALWRHTNPREEARRLFAQAYAGFSAQVMALDDDPTGTQTVHDVDVLTSWDEESLAQALAGEKRLFFVLTNSRSFSAEKTEAVHREIAQNALRAARRAGKELLVISRGDSTLRGHYPLETAVLRDTFAQESGAPFAGEVLCPFFREGGRFTMDGVHYVKEGETLVPAAQTEFAADATFGYRHSYLPEYIEEKSGGRVRASQVYCITCKQLRSFALDEMVQSLEALEGYRYIV